ncbi:MAG: M23 family metallopeptidase [Actinomycetota bacterium]|nr:M23 family metallopeptidase [Actinomycetota bacterium]
MSSRDAATRGRFSSPFTVAGFLLTAGSLLLAGLFPAASQARGEIDPMREATPSPRFERAPDVAPRKGSLIPLAPLAGSPGTNAGVSGKRGGMSVPKIPRITGVTCVKQCVSARRATPGAVVRITGGYLDDVTRVVFRGKNKWIRTKYRARRPAAVRAVVPKRAVDGQVFVVDGYGERSNRSADELKVVPVSRIPKEVFPVRGPFSFGSSGSRFGSGRPGHTHQGQDMSASCGTKIVSARKGRVSYNQWHSAAGNYVVINNAGSNTNFVYMHMIRPSRLKVGTRVGAGTPIGRVGSTGRSSGCHLHFEYWVGPWQTGGKPIDPLRYLKSLRK